MLLCPKVTLKVDTFVMQHLEGVGHKNASVIKCSVRMRNQGCIQVLENSMCIDRNEDFTHLLNFFVNAMHSSSSTKTRKDE